MEKIWSFFQVVSFMLGLLNSYLGYDTGSIYNTGFGFKYAFFFNVFIGIIIEVTILIYYIHRLLLFGYEFTPRKRLTNPNNLSGLCFQKISLNRIILTVIRTL